MIKNILRLTVAGYVWKRYKKAILSILLLFAYFWLVGKLHEDYISYAALNKDSSFLGGSFILKWLAFIAGFIICYLINFGWPNLDTGKNSHQATGATNSIENTGKKTADTQAVNRKQQAKEQNGKNDPFHSIRQRKSLRSKADFVIEKNTN